MGTAEFHSQTAIEAAKKIYADLKERGKSAEDIKDITIRTHEACVRIIDKQFKAMDNFADRDHCIQVSEDILEPFSRHAHVIIVETLDLPVSSVTLGHLCTILMRN